MGKHSAEVPALTHAPTAAEVLADLPDDWYVLDEVHEISPEVSAVDRVVIGPGGLFVVVSTDWRGPVCFEDGDVLDGGTSRRAELEVVLDTAVEVARLSGTYAEWIVPVLAVESEESFRGTVTEVHVCSTPELLAVLDEPGSVLPPSHVKYAAQVLHSAGRPEPEPEPVVMMPLRVVPDATAPLPALADEPTPAESAPPRPALVVAQPATAPATPAAPAVVPPAVPAAVPPAVVGEGAPAEPAAPVGPDGKKLTGRAARVAAALETAAAEAAKVAADQGGGEEAGKKNKKRKPKDAEQHTRVRALVRLIVVVALLGAGGLFGPKLVPAVEDAIGRLDGTPACVPATVATADEGPVTVSVPKVAKDGTKLTKAQRVKARKRAEARARRLAAHPVKAQALSDATC